MTVMEALEILTEVETQLPPRLQEDLPPVVIGSILAMILNGVESGLSHEDCVQLIDKMVEV